MTLDDENLCADELGHDHPIAVEVVSGEPSDVPGFRFTFEGKTCTSNSVPRRELLASSVCLAAGRNPAGMLWIVAVILVIARIVTILRGGIILRESS